MSTAGQSAYEESVDVILTGIAVILPLVITVYILDAVMAILVSVLDPVVRALVFFEVVTIVENSPVIEALRVLGLYRSVASFLAQLVALVLLVVIVVGLGILGRHRYGDRLIEYFDSVFMAVPGIGTVYKSFRRMSEVMLESEMENFRSVKLVEFPREGTYVIGFETARPPLGVRDSVGVDDMVTLFLPLAPNPVMGGFLTHMPGDRVMDVEMTVEEGVRNIITSGIGTQDMEEGMTEQQLEEFGFDPEELDGFSTADGAEPDDESSPEDETGSDDD